MATSSESFTQPPKQLEEDVRDLRARSEGMGKQVTRLANDLHDRIPAGTGILGLKEDLDEAVAAGEKQLHGWGVILSELVARISVLEGVALKLTNTEPRRPASMELLDACLKASEELWTAEELGTHSLESCERIVDARQAVYSAREAFFQGHQETPR